MNFACNSFFFACCCYRLSEDTKVFSFLSPFKINLEEKSRGKSQLLFFNFHYFFVLFLLLYFSSNCERICWPSWKTRWMLQQVTIWMCWNSNWQCLFCQLLFCCKIICLQLDQIARKNGINGWFVNVQSITIINLQ